jgi:hypothetical protein
MAKMKGAAKKSSGGKVPHVDLATSAARQSAPRQRYLRCDTRIIEAVAQIDPTPQPDGSTFCVLQDGRTVDLERKSLHPEWLGFAIAAGCPVECAAIARLEGTYNSDDTCDKSNDDNDADNDPDDDDNDQVNDDDADERAFKAEAHVAPFAKLCRSKEGTHYEAVMDEKSGKWNPVNLLVGGPRGATTQFSDAVSYTPAQVMADKAVTETPVPAAREEREKRQSAVDHSLHHRAMQLLAMDSTFSVEVISNPDFVRVSPLGGRASSATLAVADLPVAVTYQSTR